MTRARWHEQSKTAAGQGESISIDFICSFNMKLTCVKANWAAIPVTSEFFEITRYRSGMPDLVILRENPKTAENPFPPPVDGLTEFMNTDNIELLKNDRITVTYANTEDQECSAEIILEQV